MTSLLRNYSVEDALLLGIVYDEYLGMDPNAPPECTYKRLIRSILNEYERDVEGSILEFLRAYVLSIKPEFEYQVVDWINFPDQPENPIREVILTWHERIQENPNTAWS